MAFYNKEKCEKCILNNNGFNPEHSNTSITLQELSEYTEKASIYSQASNGRFLKALEFTGEQECDDVRFIDPSTTIDGSDTVQIHTFPFFSIVKSSDTFTSEYDGYIGIAPFISEEGKSFMNYLK